MEIPDDFAPYRDRLQAIVKEANGPSAKKPRLFTHNDMDGAGAAVLLAAAVPALRIQKTGYEKVNAQVKESLTRDPLRPILFTDMSVDDETAELLDAAAVGGLPVLLLDHHKSALRLNVYPWAYVDSRACGALLTAQALEVTGPAYTFAQVIDDYDRWLHQDPRSRTLNTLFYILGFDRFVERFSKDMDITFTENEQLLLTLEAEKQRHYSAKVLKTTAQFSDQGVRYGVAYCSEYVSDVAHELLEKLDLDVVVLVDPYDEKVSLRSRLEVDVSVLAEKFGGGGHKNAAGLVLPELKELAASLKQVVFSRIVS